MSVRVLDVADMVIYSDIVLTSTAVVQLKVLSIVKRVCVTHLPER
jgi:hypothetical protein